MLAAILETLHQGGCINCVFLDVWKAELASLCATPSIEVSPFGQNHRVKPSTRYLLDLLLVKEDHLGRHVSVRGVFQTSQRT